MVRARPGDSPGVIVGAPGAWKMPVLRERLSAFGARLAERRGDILANWAAKVDADPLLLTGASLPLAQLHDHLSALLEDFELRLGMVGAAARSASEGVQAGDAAAHGLHRWQQGFDLTEVVRELGRLNETMVAEIDRCAREPLLEGHDLCSEVHRIWAGIYSVATGSSVEQFFKLQQIEAAGHVQDLEQALESLQALETQRASLWQQAAHDLRGNLSVVSLVAAGLATPVGMAEKRERFLGSLDRNVRALHSLLEDVTSLARLQGGQEVRIVAPLDAAQLVRDLVAAMESFAQERGLQLAMEGPAEFPVDGDAIKIRRIVSNLLLNALRYTIRGGVTLRWGHDPHPDAPRWFVEVEDTGPGFQFGPTTPLAGAINVASVQANDVAQAERDGEVIHVAQAQAPPLARTARNAAPVAKASACRSSSGCARCWTPPSRSTRSGIAERASRSCCRSGTNPELARRRSWPSEAQAAPDLGGGLRGLARLGVDDHVRPRDRQRAARVHAASRRGVALALPRRLDVAQVRLPLHAERRAFAGDAGVERSQQLHQVDPQPCDSNSAISASTDAVCSGRSRPRRA